MASFWRKVPFLMAASMRVSSCQTTRPAPRFMWPTSEFPNWPSGSPTASPPAMSWVPAYRRRRVLKAGMPATKVASKALRGPSPKPSRMRRAMGPEIMSHLFIQHSGSWDLPWMKGSRGAITPPNLNQDLKLKLEVVFVTYARMFSRILSVGPFPEVYPWPTRSPIPASPAALACPNAPPKPSAKATSTRSMLASALIAPPASTLALRKPSFRPRQHPSIQERPGISRAFCFAAGAPRAPARRGDCRAGRAPTCAPARHW